MITQLEFKEIVKSYINDVQDINIDTFDNYIYNCDYTQYVHNCNFNKVIGDIFEYICKFYLLDREYEVYLFNEIPIYLRDKFNLGNVDKGIDIIFKYEDEWWGVQCKWRKNNTLAINKDLVSGFLEEIKQKKLDHAYIITNVIKSTKYHDINNVKWLTRGKLKHTFNKEFFNFILTDEKQAILEEKFVIKLRDYQEEALTKLTESIDTNIQCILACGTGKSIIMLEYSKKFNKILILLPSLQLISQFYKKISSMTKDKNMPNKKVLCICSDMDKDCFSCGEANDKVAMEIMQEFIRNDDFVHYTTNKEAISKELKRKNIIVLCTYQSSSLLKGEKFNLGMFDEAHKTVNNAAFSFALDNNNITIEKRVYFTATPKYYAGKNNDVVSMNNKAIYGDIIYEYSFNKAIEEKYILDFQVVTYVVPDNMNDIVHEKYIKNDKLNIKSEMLISAILLAEHIKTDTKCTKILTYHNSIKNVTEFKKTLYYVFEKFGIHANIYTLNGSTRMSIRNKIFEEFKSEGISIICSAKVLNEGVDIPCVNCVMFVDPRGSTIDVTQCVGRGLRLYEGQEKCSIIIPIHYDHQFKRSNYSEIIRILSAMADIDNKLIENFILKNGNNKIVVRQGGIVSGLCWGGNIKYDMEKLITNLTLVISESKSLSFEYKKSLLFIYCDNNKCAPFDNTYYSGVRIGEWLTNRKKDINSENDVMYKALGENQYVKENLNKYLINKNKNKLKDNYTNEQWIELFNEYITIAGKCPIGKTKYKDKLLGSWFYHQKEKINNDAHPMYIALTNIESKNKCVQEELDRYLKVGNDKLRLPQDKMWEKVVEYTKIETNIIHGAATYDGYNIGRWVIYQMKKINSYDDKLYKQMAENDKVKDFLDTNLKNKFEKIQLQQYI